MSALTNIRDYLVKKAAGPQPLRALRNDVEFAIDTGRVLVNEVQLISNPERTDILFELFAILRKHRERFEERLTPFIDRLYDDVELQAMYEDRYDPPRPDVEILKTLPEGTLGREFVRFLEDNDLELDFYPEIENRFDDRFEFVEARIREVHDVWHVITGIGTDVPGEIALQWFTFQQMEIPGTIMLVAGGLQHLLWFRPEELAETVKQMNAVWNGGAGCRPLLSFKHENYWARPLTELREMVGIAPEGVLTKGGES